MEVLYHELVLHAAVGAKEFGEGYAWEVGLVPVVGLGQVVLQHDGEGLVTFGADGEVIVADHAEADVPIFCGEEVGVGEELGVEVHLIGAADLPCRNDVFLSADGVANLLQIVAVGLEAEGAVVAGWHAADLRVEGDFALFVSVGVVVCGGLIDGTCLCAYPEVEAAP